MTSMKPIVLFSFLLFGALGSPAQTLEWPDVRQQVLAFHPRAKQAALLREQATATRLRARGGFDPKAFADYNNKTFNGKQYFEYASAGVKLPTWAGLELKGAYQYAAGEYLNPENKLPKNGQANFGLEWSLGQGLFFDERRAGLLSSDIGLTMVSAEQRAIQNDLLLECAKSYWNWVFATQSLRITENAWQQASIRHNGLVESFRQGDKPAIDTLESFIQVQSRTLDVQFARTEAQNAAIELSTILWNDQQQTINPERLPGAPDLLAQSIQAPEAAVSGPDLALRARQQHPQIQLYEGKLKLLDVERRLKREKRKPVVDLSYYLLGDAWSFFPSGSATGAGVLSNNSKWGLDVSYPLLNRKARGDYQITQIKLAQTELELRQKMQEIESKVLQYANDLQNLRAQVVLFREMAGNFKRLLDAENEKLRQGESSVFLINTREQRWLDAQLKLLKLLAEEQKAAAGLQWASGTLAE